ncbi:aminoacyl-tRNA hydrolase [Arthrobacter sp. MYb227]|uniref:alternative ribosome rescue aminoacyl-tRNA hydrolase ArfB n=1 Tax=Arthrobacter sp. MYb227 TaxID=1848601 RepID=UPI000CFD76C3|nr:alternative ribosome rescue aminoacyl-tRNA hydrolase ArfB [Arthrobacter sp. MYb227]PQZ93630.1 aminoacyl-tRNA hydrolase [Arthrobacter sp. MYb227]
MVLEVSKTLSIPAAELSWRFSRSSGPGGQHVNTSDSRVELSWDIAHSEVLTDVQRERVLDRLDSRLIAGVLTIASSTQRSQLRNREIALEKLAELIVLALAPGPAKRRATKPTRGSVKRRLAAKGRRSETKKQRQRPSSD